MSRPQAGGVNTQALCADYQGFSLHAPVRCGTGERHQLVQVCRYITRPAMTGGAATAQRALGRATTPPNTPPRTTPARASPSQWARKQAV